MPKLSASERAERRRFLRSAGWKVEAGDPLCICTRQDLAFVRFGDYYINDVCLNCRRRVCR